MAKNYIRLDKVNASAYLDSVISTTESLLAGQFVTLGALVDGEPELTTYTKTVAGKESSVFLAPVIIDQGYPDFDPADQTTKAGKAVRAIHIDKGMIISINVENAVGVIAGDDVAVGTNGLGFKKAVTDDFVIGKAIAIDTLDNIGDLLVVRF